MKPPIDTTPPNCHYCGGHIGEHYFRFLVYPDYNYFISIGDKNNTAKIYLLCSMDCQNELNYRIKKIFKAKRVK